MPNAQYAVTPIRRTKEIVMECVECPVCGLGEMIHAGVRRSEGFVHRCDACCAAALLAYAFPRIAPEQPNNPYNL